MSNQTGQLVLADLFDYVNVPFAQSHPDRLATLARIAGLNPAPVDRCRVLELGCGRGANLVSMAYTLRNSTFLGLDLAEKAIGDATATIAALGLENIRYVCQNLLEFDPGGQTFDYVIAHGFYSWVPQLVRDKLMAIISQVLAPHGVAYLSYNAYPGSYSSQRLRDFSLLHLDTMRITNPDAVASAEGQIRETIRLMQLLRDQAPANSSSARGDVFFEAKLTLELPPEILSPLIFHDLIADHWDPFTLQQFVAHAEANGLQFMDEADPAEPDLPPIPEPLKKLIREIAGDDRILKTQYVDYLISRKFHRCLICRNDAPVAKEDQVQAIQGMYAATQLKETNTAPDGSVTFEVPGQVTMSTPAPAVIGLLRRLIAAYPRRVAIKEFETSDPESNLGLYALCLRMYRAGSVELYTQPSPAGPPSAKPLASALARYQSQQQVLFGNLLHKGVELRGDNAVWFLNLLDGTRDHVTLIEEAGRRFPDHPRDELSSLVSARLDELQMLGLLHDRLT